MAQSFMKDVDAVLDYTIDWSTWLGSDTISSSSWSVETGITEDSDTNDTDSATVWLSGGAAGTTYAVTNSIVTAAAREEDRTIYITVQER